MIVLILLVKSVDLIRSIAEPLTPFLSDHRILGVGTLSFLILLVLALICYLAGRRAEKKNLKSFLPFIEDNILMLIPGYTLLKSSAGEPVGSKGDVWKAILVGDEGDWKFGIEVEQHDDGYSVVFFPEPPDAKSGEIKLIHSSKVKRIDMTASKLIATTRKYGQGSSNITAQLKT